MAVKAAAAGEAKQTGSSFAELVQLDTKDSGSSGDTQMARDLRD